MSLKRQNHDAIINRWFAVRTPGNSEFGKPDYDTSHIMSVDIGYFDWSNSRYEHGAGDELRSYGAHFPLVTAIRNRPKNGRMGAVRLWLLNGDVWGGSGGFGNSTSSQQGMVRSLAENSGIPSIILPHSALSAAGIEFGTITPLAQDADMWFTEEFRTTEFPADGEWKNKHECVDGTGYYTTDPRTGERVMGPIRWESMDSIPEDIRAYFDSDGKALSQYYLPTRKRTVFGRTVTDHIYPNRDYVTGDMEMPRPNNQWGYGARDHIYVPPVYRYVGRRLVGRHGEYTINPDGSYSQSRSRHQLGQSVFRAAYRGNNGKRYFANFLSGVDTTPTGSGYFLVQLPKGADVSSVSAAIESLKPATVRTAESMGIDVKRQGDLFAIPTEFDMRKLRTMGAEFRQSRLAGEGKRAAIREKWENRFATALMALEMPVHSWEYRQHPDNVQWRNYKRMQAHYSELGRRELREFDSVARIHTQRELYGTRHVGTDIAILPNGVMLARGTMRHSGGDHSMLRFGKVWHIIVRNTVPLAR